jgi:fatty-acyl-CoA synthase
MIFLHAVANRLANWCASSLALKEGDVVALVMSNRPEFVITWLAFAKIGVATAFINHNLRGSSLEHCIRIARACAVVFDAPHSEAVLEVTRGSELASLTHVQFGNDLGSPLLTPSESDTMRRGTPAVSDAAVGMASASLERPSRLLRNNTNLWSTFGLIYTSGTTGLPKASVITHSRLHMAACLFSRIFHVTSSDRIYTVLPLYHASGGLIGAGMMIYQGATLIIRPRFSASAFWADCKRYRATVIQYIGELCRYLVNSPLGRDERDHGVRLAIGNGLRPDVWGVFQERFSVPQVGEFYAATEGNTALFNWCTSPEDRGAVGRMGPLAWAMGIMTIVKFDEESEEPVRDPKTGLCVVCQPGEKGELLGLIAPGDPTRQFRGYYGDQRSTSKKVLRDVLKPGDQWFRSGDLLVRDEEGRCWFKDRIGDTFRWKGENVATTEVAEAIGGFREISEANVYGVEVPGKDGRAGMAAVVLSDAVRDALDADVLSPPVPRLAADRPADAEAIARAVDLASLYSHLSRALPPYAVPVFLRILPDMDTTGTFKHQKVRLRKEGCDPTVVSDVLFMTDPAAGTYVPLTIERWAAILKGESKL